MKAGEVEGVRLSRLVFNGIVLIVGQLELSNFMLSFQKPAN